LGLAVKKARPRMLGTGEDEPSMQEASEQSISVWMTSATMPRQPALRQDVSANVCVVGAGIAGMTPAYLLARQGKSVVDVDDGPIAGGQSQRTTAHLSNAIDD